MAVGAQGAPGNLDDWRAWLRATATMAQKVCYAATCPDDSDGASTNPARSSFVPWTNSVLRQLDAIAPFVEAHIGEFSALLLRAFYEREVDAGDAQLLLSAWQTKLAKVRAYVAALGALPPRSHPSLGEWVSTQREAYKAWKAGKPCKQMMDDERAAALEAVEGWPRDEADYNAADYTYYNAVWQAKLAELRAYVAALGALPPRSHPSLGEWVSTQRKAYKAWKAGKPCKHTMDDERAAALEAVEGWPRDGAEYSAVWGAKLEELRAHVAAHGALPPQTHPSLGSWIGTQRAAFKAWKAGKPCTATMDDDRAAALEAVKGWAWV